MKPNIIFCHVDQLTHTAIRDCGNRFVATPNIDRLRKDGFSFDLSQTAYPVCCPARASWYTGRMSCEHGVVRNGRPIRDDLPDLGRWLGARGYDCYYAGKWHVPGRHPTTSFKEIFPYFDYGEMDDANLAQIAEAFLDQRVGTEPFFLNIGFENPHDVCYLNLSKDSPSMKLGIEFVLRDHLPPLPANYDASCPIENDFHVPDWSSEQVRLYGYYYYRMVEMVDAEIGRVYAALQRFPGRDNTLFIFSSDHGELSGSHNRITKNLLWEESLRVPLTFVWPGKIPAGGIDDTHCVSGVDVTATILDYAGAPSMPGMTIARSVRPLFSDPDASWREYTPSETLYDGLQQGFRDTRYKSIFNLEDGTVKLFDFVKDPQEMTDLADHDEYAAVLRRHRNFLKDYNETMEWSDAYRAEVAKRNIRLEMLVR